MLRSTCTSKELKPIMDVLCILVDGHTQGYCICTRPCDNLKYWLHLQEPAPTVEAHQVDIFIAQCSPPPSPTCLSLSHLADLPRLWIQPKKGPFPNIFTGNPLTRNLLYNHWLCQHLVSFHNTYTCLTTGFAGSELTSNSKSLLS